MKYKDKAIIIICSLMIVSCIFYSQEKQVEKLDEKYSPGLGDDELFVFKNNKLKQESLFYKFNKSDILIHDNKYYEVFEILYCSEDMESTFLINNSEEYCFRIYIAGYIYDKLGITLVSKYDNVTLGENSFYEIPGSYQQNGHIYPDVYTFEMDTVTAMEDWDTTMNLFPDVRKVWYSLSRGIVRYDMKDGESYKLVE